MQAGGTYLEVGKEPEHLLVEEAVPRPEGGRRSGARLAVGKVRVHPGIKKKRCDLLHLSKCVLNSGALIGTFGVLLRPPPPPSASSPTRPFLTGACR